MAGHLAKNLLLSKALRLLVLPLAVPLACRPTPEPGPGNVELQPFPRILSLSVNETEYGETVTIAGEDFRSSQGNGLVRISHVDAEVISWSTTSIAIKVPSGVEPGKNAIAIIDAWAGIDTATTISVRPTVSNVSEVQPSDRSILVRGMNLGSRPGTLRLGDTDLPIVSWATEAVRAQVPADLAAGPYTVMLSNKLSDKNEKTVTIRFAIDSLVPSTAEKGAIVTLTGRNFGKAQRDSVVTVGGVPAIVTAWQPTAISFLVPTGASYGMQTVVLTIGAQTDPSQSLSVAAVVGSIVLQLSKAALKVSDLDSQDDEESVMISVFDTVGAPLAGAAVTATGDLFSLATTQVTTDASGSATLTMFAGNVAGVATLSVVCEGATETANFVVWPAAPVTITTESPAPNPVQVRGAPVTTSAVSFVVRDSYGNPVSEPMLLAFAWNGASLGASLLPVSATTIQGRTQTHVYSGSKAGTVRVTATYSPTGLSSMAVPVTVTGDVPVTGKVNATFATQKLSGFLSTAVTTTVTVFLADRFANPVSPGTVVHAAAEAGVFVPVTAVTDQFGKARFDFLPDGRLPLNHASAQQVAFQVAHAYPAVVMQANGYVNTVFGATGESGYEDVNANGVYDELIDTRTYEFPEVYVDLNDNGAYDSKIAEPYWDANLNGTWNEQPGYRRPVTTWTQTRLIYTGEPAIQLVPSQFVDMNADGVYDPQDDLAAVGGPLPAVFPYASPATLFTYTGNYVTTSTTVWVSLMDENGNALPTGSSVELASTLPYATISLPPIGLRTVNIEPDGKIVPFFANASDLITPGQDSLQLCATVHVADINADYSGCIDAVAF